MQRRRDRRGGIRWEAYYNNEGVNVTDRLGVTSLHTVVAFQLHEHINSRINNGALVNAQTFLGATPLHIAVARSELALNGIPVPIITLPDEWILNRLLNHEDIDCNLVDYLGQTPLMLAVTDQQDMAARMLLQRNANPNICNKFCRTPLHEAFSQALGNIENLLLLRGASVYSVDNEGQTPIDILLKNDSRSNDNKKDILKLIAFKYSVTDNLKRKLARFPQLSHFFNNCCDEVDGMRRDFISGNITVHDFVCNCFNEVHFENIVLQIHKPVIERLVKDIYRNYFANILNYIPNNSLLVMLEMTAISRTRSQRGEMNSIAYVFSNFAVVSLMNQYLSHLDIISLIVAFSYVRNSESFHDMHDRVPICLV